MLKSDQCGIETRYLPPPPIPPLRSNRTNVGLKHSAGVQRTLTHARSNRTNVGLKRLFTSLLTCSSALLKSDQCGIETQNSESRHEGSHKLKSDQCGIEALALQGPSIRPLPALHKKYES